MCGIAGIINLREKVDRSVVEKASPLLFHRGPDDAGLFFEDGIGLLHQRLSVIDLAGGKQPMFNENRTLVLVFNGEVYNFMDLRSELEAKGHVFSTRSDTEVVLHSFEEWGTDCVKKFYGMFAFALYNRNDDSLFLSRDRCGEKPLYYYHENGKIFFASEVQALLAMLGRTPLPDQKSMYLYLRLGYIPAPFSFYHGIKKMQPGSCLFFQNGVLKNWAYYKPSFTRNEEPKVNENDLLNELDTTLCRAVKKMLISDVPLGAFLSGGLDSSLIVAMMAKEGITPETFSISFSNSSFDESPFAQQAARFIGCKHTQYLVEFDNFEQCLSIMDGFGEPFADASSIPTYYLSRETRKNVTVALSGDGGDELFGGYRRYLSQRFLKYYLSVPFFLRKGIVGNVLSWFSDSDVYYADSFIKSTRLFVERAESCSVHSELMFNTIFSHDEIHSLFPDLVKERVLIEEVVNAELPGNSVEALMVADRHLYLPDDILVKVDRMSMKNSLEVRAPFLDPDVLSVTERIPLFMKIKGLNQKYLLKKLAQRYLPCEIVFRKKHGFVAPLSEWIKKAGKEDIKKRMSPSASSQAIDQLLTNHFEGNFDHSHKIFALIILDRYLRER